MDRFNALGRATQIMAIGAVLLFIDLFLPWQDFDIGDLGQFSGWRGFAGVVLGLVTIALIAWIGIRLASIDIPLPVSEAMATAVLGGLILLFAIIKLLTILGDEPTIWAFIGVVLAVVIAIGAWQVVQGAGGMDTLRSEIPSRAGASTMESPPPASTAPPETTPQAAPPPAEAQPMPEPEAPSDREPARDDMDEDRRT